jgi:gamma-glutamyltranspeptidase/glutathione hydrolase
MVVSSHYLASEAGARILEQGGNAVDAAVATAFCLAVTLPRAGNIGGGGFLVYHGVDGYVTTFDFREKAPLAASERMYLDQSGEIRDDSNHEGLLAVGVPGTVAGLALAHERLGSLDWEELLEPAVTLARDGFPFPWEMREHMEWLATNREEYPTTARAFLKDGVVPFQPGERFTQPDLARTLRRIQQEGPDDFYRGETARLIARFMRQHDGLITLEDLDRYRAIERAPIVSTYDDLTVYGMGPPSSGGVAIAAMLNILEHFDLRSMEHNSALAIHVMTEAMRRAFADRAEYLGDPDFNPDMPVDRLVSKRHAANVARSIALYSASRSDAVTYGGEYGGDETTHISVVDTDGNAVSMTYTLEYSYGSDIVVEGAGFLLNNEMGDFNAIPGRTDRDGRIGSAPNLVAPGKRMLSSMSPTIVSEDGQPVLILGSPGGRRIINAVLQVILNVFEFGMDVGDAVEAPRTHHQWLPDTLYVEEFGVSVDTRRMLQAMGHTIRSRESIGRVNAILIDREDGLLFGAADTRNWSGKAVGY